MLVSPANVSHVVIVQSYALVPMSSSVVPTLDMAGGCLPSRSGRPWPSTRRTYVAGEFVAAALLTVHGRLVFVDPGLLTESMVCSSAALQASSVRRRYHAPVYLFSSMPWM